MRATVLVLPGLASLLLCACDCADSSNPPGGDAGADGGEDGGDAGRIPGRAVRVPATVDAEVGAIVTVEVTVVAGTQDWDTTITAEAPRFDYIEGQPAYVSPLSIDSVHLDAGQQKLYELRLQTLLTWDHTITVRVHGEAYEVPVHAIVRRPLIGVEGMGCDGPHVLAYGPDCGPCGPETTSEVCAGSQPLASCHPIGFQVPEGVDETAARAACDASAALAVQFTRSVPASFSSVALDPATLDLTELTWVSGVLEEQLRTRPLPVPGYDAWWMHTCDDCANADGSRGAYDPANAIVFGGLETMGTALGGVRGVPGLQLAEASATFAHLCPCALAGTACAAGSGPDQPACAAADALYTEALGTAYGPLVAALATRVAAGVHAANPEAAVVSAPVDTPNRGLTPLTRVALDNGLGDAVDALGIELAPMPAPTWLDPMPNCALAQPGCETAPPFTDWTALLPPEGGGDPVPTIVSAAETWRQLDRDVDPGELVVGLAFAGWDRMPLWITSLRAGFHGTSPREGIAALRAATILTGARAAGLAFAFAPTDPAAYEVVARTLSGTHPVERAETPEGYDDLVVRFFSRPGEDVLVAWNNADAARVAFVAAADGDYLDVTLTRVRGDGDTLAITTETLESPDTQIEVAPLTEIAILKVDRTDDLEFRWVELLQL